MGAKMEASESLINKINSIFSDGVHFATPNSSLRMYEVDLVQGVLKILQGLSSSVFYWDNVKQRFYAKSGIYVTHLSQTSLHVILNQFIYAATCLKAVESIVNKVETHVRLPPPTLRAFACSVSAWLKKLQDIALKEEVKIIKPGGGTVPTLLGLASSLSSLFSGAEYLLQVVNGAIPRSYFDPDSSVPAAEIAVHILDFLYKKLNDICPVQGGEEDAYRMLLYIFIGSLLPYIEALDSWLFEGTLDDPFEEMFFHANKAISVNEADFWEMSYLFRRMQYQKLGIAGDRKGMTGRESVSVSTSVKGKEQNSTDVKVCPFFIKEIAVAIVSAGKSLQLIRHAPTMFSLAPGRRVNIDIVDCGNFNDNYDFSKARDWQSIAGLTLSEVFCISLAALIGHGDHISKYFCQDEPLNSKIAPLFRPFIGKQKLGGKGGDIPLPTCSEKVWSKFLVDMWCLKGEIEATDFLNKEQKNIASGDTVNDFDLMKSFCPENPVTTVCHSSLNENEDIWSALNLSKKCYIPPLDDEGLRNAIFSGKHEPNPFAKGTNYTFGFQFAQSEYLRSQDKTKLLEEIFPFPTLLPSFQEKLFMSEFLPFQKNSTLSSRVLSWVLSVEPKVCPLSVVILQECLIVYMKKKIDYIGRNILSKLLIEWRLMDELGVLRAIYLLGSGDLLQHFLCVIFDKLDKGESWDDDFELNMILQESIANSADGMLLSAPDALVVSITESHGFSSDEQHDAAIILSNRKNYGRSFGIDGLDSLKFTYKVSWPLELIANLEAIRKYNQVMCFLLKVKRAKFALDKARRWMWKVYHSAWSELCEGMAAAASLDEVIDVHEAYLLLIQRQCFVVPDKLGALISSRINSILGLALDFYAVQQTLSSSGSVSSMKARCEMEVNQIEKQFDDCIAFLLRVLSFRLNVGHFPHLADLVTRINYNYFYMSDNGNLITAPGSGTVLWSNKMGKAATVRTD